MNTAQVLQFPARAAERAPETLPRLVLMHRGETFDYETPEDFEAEFQAMLIREGWTPPPEAGADASSPPEALAQPVAPAVVQARPWPPVQDFLIVALGLAVVFLALAAGL
jgi:hypothetical protein